MARILLTGGAGFLGQYLVRHLAEEGHDVRVIDLRPSAHPAVDIHPLCTRVTCGVDITKPSDLVGHCEGMDTVFHLAGVISFWRKHKDLMHSVNVIGTRNVLSEAVSSGVSTIVHVSSVAAIGYGDDDAPVDENHDFDWSRAAKKPYMLSKHLAEVEALRFGGAGARVIVANPGLMWGPGDMLNSRALITGLAERRIPACPPGGTNVVDVRDVARGLPLVASHGIAGERYILGGHNVTFRHAYDVAADAVDAPSPRRTLPRCTKPVVHGIALLNELLRAVPPPLTSDQVDSSYRFRYFSNEKARRCIGWTPNISFERTISDAVAWLRANAVLA
jgi:dihydroflavonol-4-reductase